MSIDVTELRALSPLEKLHLVELLGDDLGESDTPIPLPEWVEREAVRRRNEMTRDKALGFSHDEAWRRIEQCNG